MKTSLDAITEPAREPPPPVDVQVTACLDAQYTKRETPSGVDVNRFGGSAILNIAGYCLSHCHVYNMSNIVYSLVQGRSSFT